MAIVADRYTLAPACCMTCGHSKVPLIDEQNEMDELAYQVRHLYQCRDCIRDKALMITRWAKEHGGSLGWSVITDGELEHLIDERNAAIQEAEAANAELRNFEELRALAGRLSLTVDTERHPVGLVVQTEPKLEKKVPKQRVQT
jgi:hypothetical protein